MNTLKLFAWEMFFVIGMLLWAGLLAILTGLIDGYLGNERHFNYDGSIIVVILVYLGGQWARGRVQR